MKIEAEEIVKIAQKYHAKQTRAGNVPYWYHCLSVAQILKNAFFITKELKGKKLDNLLIAAVGHDLYEDTTIKREEITDLYNKEVDRLIWEATNEFGDADQKSYGKKIATISEEAKLLKVADSIENAISVAYTEFDLGVKWVDDFYLPILQNFRKNIKLNQFKKYPKAASYLFVLLDFATSRILENNEKYRSRTLDKNSKK